tara:strand:+ start:5165 stop:6073 length:909 start_codon:yes stop_codon:yes gene_type:complete
MSKLLQKFFKKTELPVISAPLFIISNPKLVIEQNNSGIIGSFPALNAKSSTQLDNWISEIKKYSNDHLFAVNKIVHHSNKRLMNDLNVIVKHEVPIVITSLGVNPSIINAIHRYGGVVLHDITNNKHAQKAILSGADGLIAVCQGSGGHSGFQSPFSLIPEIREWYDGVLGISGSIYNGRSIASAIKLGADFAYIGTPFITTEEANASEEYKKMIINSTSEDIINTNVFTGIHGNYLKPSIENEGINLNEIEKGNVNFLSDQNSSKPWKNIWSAGTGISQIKEVTTTNSLVKKFKKEYKIHK